MSKELLFLPKPNNYSPPPVIVKSIEDLSLNQTETLIFDYLAGVSFDEIKKKYGLTPYQVQLCLDISPQTRTDIEKKYFKKIIDDLYADERFKNRLRHSIELALDCANKAMEDFSENNMVKPHYLSKITSLFEQLFKAKQLLADNPTENISTKNKNVNLNVDLSQIKTSQDAKNVLREAWTQ